jgi:hypothetical protein
MSKAFWVKQTLIVFVVALALITAVHLLKGNPFAASIRFGVFWSAAATAIFSATRLWRSSRREYCALCGDTAEMQQAGSGKACKIAEK